MQVCGAVCNVCAEKIFFQPDGTWCARCNTAVHKACRTEDICAGCNQPRLDPSALFVRSAYCPECMHPNKDADCCCRCGAATRWDTEQDYQARKAEIRGAAEQWIVWGLAEIGLGAVMIAATLVGIVVLHVIAFPVPLLAIAVAGDGFRRIVSGNSLKRFE